MADKVKVSHAEFQKTAAELQDVLDMLKSYKGEMSQKYEFMGETWKGEAGCAFAERSQSIISGLELNIAKLGKFILDIRQVEKLSADMDSQLAKSVKDSQTRR
ncbi:MAG: hypothetical protein FWG06_00160 [Clostridiales bacterium]|nr:hypothetical protein [Clostridiales bacterium]